MTCIMCNAPAEKILTWINDAGSGIGGGLQGGPMCCNCMEHMSDALCRFPVASQTLTIWPLGNEEVLAALGLRDAA